MTCDCPGPVADLLKTSRAKSGSPNRTRKFRLQRVGSSSPSVDPRKNTALSRRRTGVAVVDLAKDPRDSGSLATSTIPRLRLDGALPPLSQPIPQHVVEIVLGVNFLDRFIRIVLDSAETHAFLGQNRITRTWVTISRLADTTNVD